MAATTARTQLLAALMRSSSSGSSWSAMTMACRLSGVASAAMIRVRLGTWLPAAMLTHAVRTDMPMAPAPATEPVNVTTARSTAFVMRRSAMPSRRAIEGRRDARGENRTARSSIESSFSMLSTSWCNRTDAPVR